MFTIALNSTLLKQLPSLKRLWSQYHSYILIFAICFLAIWPFLRYTSLPSDTDAELHVFRLAELSRLVRGGELYPRWASNFYFGYGYPIFNYYAPFSYYVGLLFDLLPFINPVGATKLIFISSILLGGWGTFQYVRLHFGDRAGYAATAVFVYAPYIQYIDPHARGVSPESFALGLFPITLWGLESLRREPSGRRFLFSGLAVTALVTSHNIMAMVFGGVLLGWCVWQFLITTPTNFFQSRPWKTLLAYSLGIVASSFFWIPVALERNDVNLETLVGPEGSHFAYSSHFLSVGTLTSPSLWLDWGATEPAYLFNLGIIAWLATLVAFGFLIRFFLLKLDRRSKHRIEQNWQTLYWGIAAAGLVWLMLPSSSFLWNSVPVLPFIQFPWRLLGPLAAVLAILTGYATYMLEHSFTNVYRVFAPAIVGVTLVLALPLTQVQPWPSDFGETTAAAVAYQETKGRWLGTTSTADFVPATVDMIPRAQNQLLDALLANETPDRVNYAGIPDTVEVSQEQIRPLYTRYTVTSSDEFQFRLFLFDFPGWEVRLDGEIAETEIGVPEGFIVVPTPAGTHTIEVEFIDTPARRQGWQVTLAALFGLIIGAVWIGWAKSSRQHVHHHKPSRSLWLVTLSIIAISLIVGDNFHYESVGLEAAVAQQSLNENFGGQLRLVGVDVSATELSAGDSLFTTVYWRAPEPVDINYQVFIHLFAPDGSLVAQSDKLNPGDFPTFRWPQDKYIRDPHQLILPENTPAGVYTLKVGLWVQTEGWRLPLLNESGEQIDDGFVLSQIEVK